MLMIKEKKAEEEKLLLLLHLINLSLKLIFVDDIETKKLNPIYSFILIKKENV